MLIEVSSATFGYGQRAVVRADVLSLSAGRCLGIFGPNGSGKTTLVRGVTGILAPLSGQVRRNESVRIGYVPQHRGMEMHWPMTGRDIATLGVSARRRFGWAGGARRDVARAMEEMGVGEIADRPFATMSGGQQQRFILASALADRPNILVLDEPTDGLDVQNREAFLEILRRRQAEGLCIVLISHEVDDLVEVANEVAWLHPGLEADQPSKVELAVASDLPRRLAGFPNSHAT